MRALHKTLGSSVEFLNKLFICPWGGGNGGRGRDCVSQIANCRLLAAIIYIESSIVRLSEVICSLKAAINRRQLHDVNVSAVACEAAKAAYT